jgi:hypothetical protein
LLEQWGSLQNLIHIGIKLRIVGTTIFKTLNTMRGNKPMWKKLCWLYLGLYVLGVLYVIISYAIKSIQAGDFELISLILPLVFFIPGAVLALNLRGKKVSIIFTLFGLLITAVPVAGILNFNEMDLATIGKVLLFMPLLVGLCYFGYKQLFKRKNTEIHADN